MKAHFIKLSIFLLFLNACNSNTQEASSEVPSTKQLLLDSLDQAMDTLYNMGYFHGLGVALTSPDQVYYSKGFGWADLNNSKAYDEHSVQNIASISKTFIGIALLKAQELGFLKINDPIDQYLDFEVRNPYFPKQAILIQHLSNHTSTIRDTDVYNEKSYVLKDPMAPGDTSDRLISEVLNPPGSLISIADYLERVLSPKGEWYIKEHYLEAEPGKKFDYSNTGATLAALIVQEASGEPFDAFCKKHIFEPLKMEDSGWSFESINMEKHSVLFAKKEQAIPAYQLNTYPDGGLRTSAHDMGLYLQELSKAYTGKGSLLKPESYALYFKSSLDDSHFEEERDTEFAFNDEYDMGVFVGKSATGNIGHTGGDPGVFSLMFFDSETLIGRYFIVNTSINDEAAFQEVGGILEALDYWGKKIQASN